MNEEKQISLFDLLLVVADNLRLLILGPLLVGLLALGIGFVLPKSYTSEAYLQLEESAKVVEAMMRSPAVLDVVLKQFPTPSGGTDRAREELSRKFRFGTSSINQKTGAGVTKLEVEDEIPARAQGLANALIDAWLATTKPQPESLLELTRKRKLNQDALDTVSQLLKRMADETASLIQPNVKYELGTQSVQLLQLRNGYVGEIASIDLQLRGQTRDVVASPPSLPTEATKPRKSLIAVLAAFGAGLALLLWVFMRQAWTNAAQNPETRQKQGRLRAALGLSRS
jgi:capsular polysaccharide biosynthesis protein